MPGCNPLQLRGSNVALLGVRRRLSCQIPWLMMRRRPCRRGSEEWLIVGSVLAWCNLPHLRLLIMVGLVSVTQMTFASLFVMMFVHAWRGCYRWAFSPLVYHHHFHSLQFSPWCMVYSFIFFVSKWFGYWSFMTLAWLFIWAFFIYHWVYCHDRDRRKMMFLIVACWDGWLRNHRSRYVGVIRCPFCLCICE